MPRKKQKRSLSGGLRIIAGQLKGRRVQVVNDTDLRPTSDRMRETLFNWLMGEIAGRRVLDAYAGSGILGLEALSRGAGFIQFIDKQRVAIDQLHQQLNTFQIDSSRYTLHQGDALAWLGQTKAKQFDLLFLDPPFSQNLLVPTIDLLDERGWLADTALIYIESAATRALPIIPDNWQCLKEKRMGQSLASLWSIQSDRRL